MLDAAPTPTEDPLLARILAALYVAGGALAGLSLLLPHPAASNDEAVALIAAGAVAIGGVFVLTATRVRPWTIQLGVAGGSAIIAVGIHLAGAADVYSTMFVWIAAFSGLFFSLRAALLQLLWLLGCDTAALLSLTDVSGYSPVTRVVLLGIALSVVIVLTSWLVSRRRSADERTRRFFDLARDLLCTANAEGYFVELNRAWTDMLGWTADELRARPFIEFVHPDDRERTEREARGVFSGEHDTIGFENRYRAKDGSWRWLLWSCSLSRDTGLVFARATDITAARRYAVEREELVAKLDSMARTDPLTGIPNRRWLDDEIEREMSRAVRGGSSLAFAMLDLDHFKRFNDERGHPAGDAYLQQAAEAWRRAMRTSDFLARFGGEEFVLLVATASQEEAERLVERVRKATPDPMTASIGIAFWNQSEDLEALIARSDAALYAAKRLGRERTVTAGSEVRV